MTLPVPNLDSRTYDDLLAEALRRLPLHTPEYTNHNASDPGRAILEANAFLTETLLYQINRVPDQNYVAFLNLLGISPQPARAAKAELSFTLKDLKTSNDPLLVDVPLGTQVAVDDPDLDQDVVFETDRSLRALNADFGLALVPQDGAGGLWQAVTQFDSAGDKVANWLHAFHPFSATETMGKTFIFGLVLRPKAEEEHPEDRMPSGTLDLYVEATEVFDTDASGVVISGPNMQSSGPINDAIDPETDVTWEVFTSAGSSGFTLDGAQGWQPLNLSLDETNGLRTSGHITFELPSGMVGVRLGDAPAATWEAIGKIRAPTDKQDLIDLLDAGDPRADELHAALTEEVLEQIGATTNAGMLSACADAVTLADALATTPDSIDPSALDQEAWAALHPDFAAPDIPVVEVEKNGAPAESWRPLYMIRARLTSMATGETRLLNRLRLNTVGATAASTRKDERLGASTGRPGQTLRLARTPVYFDPDTETPDITLTVTHQDEVTNWTRVDDFYGAGPADTVYLLDPLTGAVQFGDGRPNGIGGAIPPAGAVVRAASYRFGGGEIANVAKDTITKLKGAITHVKSVTNPRAAGNGSDAETLSQVKQRAPSTLRRRERAVSAQDFADLARETPEAAIHSAYAVAAKVPTETGFADKPGAVSVVILPNVDHPTPQPDEATLAAVTSYLNPRRLITTELHVIGPRYFHITSLTARLKIESTADFATVSAAARAAITDWLHPLCGGEAETGWPFGQDIDHGDIYDLLLQVPGVRRVQALSIAHDPTSESIAPDVIAVPTGYLPALDPGAIGFEVSYV